MYATKINHQTKFLNTTNSNHYTPFRHIDP